MKNIKLIAIASVLAASSLVAVAHADSMNSTASVKTYMGVEGGYEKMDIQNFSYTSSLPFNIATSSASQKKPKAYINLHAGMLFPMNQTFSFGGQVGYTYYGDVKDNASVTDIFGNTESYSAKIAVQSFNLQGVARAKFNSFFVQGMAGMGLFYLTDGSNSSTRGAAIAGAEAGYIINQNFDVYVAYHHVFGTDYTTNNNASNGNGIPTINQFGLGVDYIF